MSTNEDGCKVRLEYETPVASQSNTPRNKRGQQGALLCAVQVLSSRVYFAVPV